MHQKDKFFENLHAALNYLTIFCELHKLRIQGRMHFFEKLVFLVHFRPWDLSRKMRREFLTEFSSGIIDFENKNISIVQKQ